MTDSKPLDPAEYLNDPETALEYLMSAAESGSDSEIRDAVSVIRRSAAYRISAGKCEGY